MCFSPTAIALGSSAIVKVSGQNWTIGLSMLLWGRSIMLLRRWGILWAYFFRVPLIYPVSRHGKFLVFLFDASGHRPSGSSRSQNFPNEVWRAGGKSDGTDGVGGGLGLADW